jgi:hypothetical protein
MLLRVGNRLDARFARLAHFLQKEFSMTNDTEVFYAKRFDPQSGTYVWADRTGTREAIHRDGFVIDPMSQAFCPYEWLDGRGLRRS